MSDWRETTIGDMIASGAAWLQTGPFGSQLHAHDYVASGTPVIPTEAIGRRTLMQEGLPQVSQETVNRLARHVVREGDILFARRGVQATGLSALVQKRHAGWLCGTGAILLRVDSRRVDPSFVSFALTDRRAIEWLKAHAVGAVMPNLNTDVISRLPLVLPPLNEQRRIAEVLSALDEKIEVIRRMELTLEDLARAIFDTRLVPAAPGNTWIEMPLDSAASFLNGLALQKYPPTSEGSLPVIKIAELRAGVTARTDRASIHVPAPYIVRSGDLLFSWSGTLEVVVWTGPNGALNQHLFKVTSDRFPRWFVRQWVIRHLPNFRAIAADKATTMGHIQRRHLTEATVLVPPNDVLAEVSPAMSAIEERLDSLAAESRTLGDLRDTLLPHLLSGEGLRRDVVHQVSRTT